MNVFTIWIYSIMGIKKTVNQTRSLTMFFISFCFYAEVLQESLERIRSVAQDDTAKPEVKYPREPGHRPPPEENPYNAW